MSESIASAKQRIISHMNEDHGDSVLIYAQVLAALPDASAAMLVDIDEQNMVLKVTLADEVRDVSILFEPALASAEDAHQRLIALSKEGRVALRNNG